MPRLGIYGWSNGQGGVHWYRQAEPLRVAANHGMNVDSGSQLDDAACQEYDTVLVHMLWDERNSEAWEKLAAGGNHRLIFDIDDVMWAPDWEPFAKHYTPQVLARVWRNIEISHVITTPSPIIAEYVSKFNRNVHVVPNTVPERLTYQRLRFRARPIVGFQGSPSHLTDVTENLREGVGRFLNHFPDWQMHLWGADPDEKGPWQVAGRIVNHGWQSNVNDYYRSLTMDIGIGPLAQTTFNAGKSGLRAIEYAALGIPAVLSAGPAYNQWVEQDVTGLLLEPNESWYQALSYLAVDSDRREKMGRAARERAQAWTTEANLWRWVEAWNSV